jgi:hypothetical protein
MLLYIYVRMNHPSSVANEIVEEFTSTSLEAPALVSVNAYTSISWSPCAGVDPTKTLRSISGLTHA